MHGSLGNTHHTNSPPVPGQAWDLPGLILPPGHTEVGLLARAAVPGSGLGSRGGGSTAEEGEPQLGRCTPRTLLHKCAPRSTQARQQPETHHGNAAEGVRLTIFSTVTADTDRLPHSSSAGRAPSRGRPAGAQAAPRAAHRRPRPRERDSGVEGRSASGTSGLRPGRSDVF